MALAIAVASALAIVAAESVVALAVTLMDGLVALAVLAVAALAGGWVLSVLGLNNVARSERLVFGAGSGVGLCAIVVFLVARFAAWGRAAAVVVAAVVAVAAVARVVWEVRQGRSVEVPGPGVPGDSERQVERTGPEAWLWLLVGPFLAVAVLGACLPPGILWREEAGGYDVLEYHLAVPKVWTQAGGIYFLSNNVYSNFPLAGEMLWMWMMGLRGDPIEAAFMAQFVNVGFVALFVAAAWLVGRGFSHRSGVVAGVLAGCTPWLVYLGAIAYVEPGMLALGMCALAAILRIRQDPDRAKRWSVLAGLLAGLACGFKYTAVPMIAAPWAVLLLVESGWSRRAFERVVLFVLAALAAFSPWVIRNVLNTGNPVFPLAGSVFGAKPGVWDDELQVRWEHAHSRASDAFSRNPTLAGLWRRTLGDARVGFVAVFLAAATCVRRPDRRTWGLAVVLVLQWAVWLSGTHLFARFAVVLLMPLIAMAARAGEGGARGAWRGVVAALVVIGAGVNLYRVGGLYYDHTRPGPMRHALDAYGRTAWFTEGLWPGAAHFGAVNALPEGSRVMLVGEARTYYLRRPCDYAVVFNHHPLAMAARKDPSGPALMAWLRCRGVTHLLVHWAEIGRLQATYGMDPEIDENLFERMIAAGLEEAASFRLPGAARPYATLFKVPPSTR